jgi:hypothetical protein
MGPVPHLIVECCAEGGAYEDRPILEPAA